MTDALCVATKYVFNTVTASASDSNLPSCTISTINQDREGDRVIPEGGDFGNFMKSPVLMWAHGGADRYAAIPIGTVTALEVQPGQGVRASWKWLKDDPFADRIKNAWDQGVVRASSIGFKPLQATPNGQGLDHERWELIELSLCAVPMNPEAVRTLKSLGLLDEPATILGPDGNPIAKSGASVPVKSERQSVADDPIRWNPRLSKAFDVSAQQFPPQSVEQHLVAAYCECKVKALHHCEERVPSTRMGAFLAALEDTLRDVDIDDLRNLDWQGKEAPPLYESIQLNSTRTQEFLIDGLRFLRWNDVHLCLRVEPRWFGLEVTTYAERSNRDAASALIVRTKARARELNFLKGEAFALSGEFLQRGGESFDDLFLDDKNGAAIRRLVTLLNEKGSVLENRGALLVGPPGTGKTLSGRILMNQAKATFVWVSARDFHYSGGFQGMADAFEIARECAPTVLFIEDVDNWLDGHTVDLLKTEMDGIARSSGVVTILTTNYPESLPKALIDRPGRFHDVLRFDLPNEKARAAMLARWMPRLGADDAQRAVRATAGYSGAHIRELARFAGIIAEQDSLTQSQALAKALEKLQEQRDLITSVQTTGSRYRAPIEIGITKAMVAMEKRGRVISAVNESRLRAALTALSDANGVLSEVLSQLVTEPAEAPADLIVEEPVVSDDVQHLAFDDDPTVLRLLLEPSDDDGPVLTLVDKSGHEPLFAIDPEVMRSVIADAVKGQWRQAVVDPIGERLQQALETARGRVH